MNTRTTPAAAPLRRELQELLLDLALTLQRFAMYPGGHPTVDSAVEQLTDRLRALLAERELITLGVARRQLITEGVASDSTHPMLRALAARLHRHRLGAVVFRRGVDAAELRDALSAVAVDPEHSGEPLGSASVERLSAWPHVRFYRVTYEQLQLTGQGEGDGGDDGAASHGAAQLWVGLAQAAIARGSAAPEGEDTPHEVAQAINARAGEQAYDQMIVGYMLQLAEELRRNSGPATAPVRSRMSAVIRELDPTTLQRLLEMGGDTAQRQRFMSDAVETLSPDAILEVIRAAAHTQGENISTSMMRMLTKLSAFADADAGAVGARATAEMREQVRELLDDWQLEDPNPDAYTRALESMARTSTDDASDPTLYAPEPLRMVQMGVEVGVTGSAFWRGVDALVTEGRLAELFEVMDDAGSANPAVESLWRRLVSTDHIRRSLTTDPVDFASLDRIFERLPAAAVISLLLDRLSESASRATRMGIFRRLSARGLAALPQVMERTHDTRWFVKRNMLALLGEIGTWPKSFSPLEYARDPHATVRREALQLAVRVAGERDQAVSLALLDVDERAVRIGISAAREHGLAASAVGAVLQRLDDAELSPELRAALIRLLVRQAQPAVLERLVMLVLQGRTLLGRPKLAQKSPELLAALAALTSLETLPAAPASSTGAASAGLLARVRSALQLARASDDAEIRAAAMAPAAERGGY